MVTRRWSLSATGRSLTRRFGRKDSPEAVPVLLYNEHMARFVVMQFNPQVRSLDDNIHHICSEAKKYENALIILPELFLSSYYDYDLISSHMLPTILESFIDLGKQKNLAFVGSLPVKTPRGNFNQGVYINNGRIQTKSKKNLFDKEKEVMIPGRINPIFYYQDIAFCIQVCLDIIDPLPTRFAAQRGAKLVINPATVSVDFLRAIGKARALENNITTVFCNRSGEEENGIRYLGNSSVFFADGTEEITRTNDGAIIFTL